MPTQPVLQGDTLPHPFEYRQTRGYRLVSLETVDGSIVHQVVNDSVKRTFVLEWRGVTTTQRNTILAAYEELITAPTSSNFTDPAGDTYTVTMPPNAPPVDLPWIKGTAVTRWNVSITLREV